MSAYPQYVCFEKKTNFLMGNQKWQKNLNFRIWKSPKYGQISGFRIFKFWNSNVFVIFGFPSKNLFFLKANILLYYQKIFWANSINREEDILQKVNLVTLEGGKHSHFTPEKTPSPFTLKSYVEFSYCLQKRGYTKGKLLENNSFFKILTFS